MFAGILGSRPYALPADFPLRQLVLDTLVAAVDTLRMLPLLYRVNADVLVAALLLLLLAVDPACAVAADLLWCASSGRHTDASITRRQQTDVMYTPV